MSDRFMSFYYHARSAQFPSWLATADLWFLHHLPPMILLSDLLHLHQSHSFLRLRFPGICLQEAVRRAIVEFDVPEGYEKVEAPVGASSVVWEWGVKLKSRAINKKTGGHDYRWACLGSDTCRSLTRQGTFVSITQRATSNATKHISEVHKSGD